MSSVNHHHHLNNNMAPPTGQPIATPGGRPQPPRVTGMYSNPILSSDEAPDTGDDSDEDVITSYLMQHGVAPSGTTGDQSSQSAGIATETPILEDNLLQLSRIQDKIQQIRIDNAAAALNSSSNSSSKQLPSCRTSALMLPNQSRLSTSCPSLNNSLMEPDVANNNSANVNNNSSSSETTAALAAAATTVTGAFPPPSRASRRPKAGKTSKLLSRHNRSVSVSSGESDVDETDGKTARRSSSSHHHHHHHVRSSTAPLSMVTPSQHPPPKTADGGTSGSSYQRFFQSSSRGSSKHRDSSTYLSPVSAFGGGSLLQKSISTPSIVADQAKGNSTNNSGNSTLQLPEPTHVFLQRLISDHDWIRKPKSTTGGGGGGGAGGVVAGGFEGNEGGNGGGGVVSHSAGGSDSETQDETDQQQPPHKASTAIRPTGVPSVAPLNLVHSPQLSLEEFLKNDPTLEDEDRKRRRKKERSSLFFRKKKDKSGASKATSGGPSTGGVASGQIPLTLSDVGAPILIDRTGSTGSSGDRGAHQDFRHGGSIKSVSSVTSSAVTGPGPVQGGTRTFQGHSYSMSSLRKGPVISGPNSASSNFYLATRGEMSSSSPRTRRRAKSQWNIVGRKLGVIKNHEDREEFGHHEGETAGLIDGEYIPSEEFPEGGPAAIRDLETAPFLRIQDDEAETWQQTVPPAELRALRPVDVKRQEHIYEVIITESNHCQVLQVIQKIFIEGMYKYLNLSKEVVDRIFPCIDKMIDIHMSFLEELRVRQNEQPVVTTIADILCKQFSGEKAEKWREAYGVLSSSHNEAVAVFKDLMKSDRRFQQFIRQCSENPLLKKKGVPECILFVTMRITKYHLLIEPLIKTSKDRPAEQEHLKQAYDLVKNILKDVNSKVAEKHNKSRLLDIYHKLDAKSNIAYNGKKFKKSDILSANRKLMFEGVGTLNQAKNRSILVTVVVLSDVMIFLQESNQKYFFIMPENKPSIIPVRSLIAGEREGGSTKSLVILSADHNIRNNDAMAEPERYEIDIQQPPTRDDWISGIRGAVDNCSPGSDSEGGLGYGAVSSSEEVLRRKTESKHLRQRRLIAELRSKDIELAKLLEDKMNIMKEMLQVVASGPDHDQVPEQHNINDSFVAADRLPSLDLPQPDYVSMVREQKEANSFTREQLLSAVQEASRLASSLYSSAQSNQNLSRSASSVGERQSADYAAPALPKRAETFSEFDGSQGPNGSKKLVVQEIDLMSGNTDEAEFVTGQVSSSCATAAAPNLRPADGACPIPPPSINVHSANQQQQGTGQGNTAIPPLLTLDPVQQKAAYQMTHYLNGLMCMVSEHFTSLESLKAQLTEIQEKSRLSGGRYVQNQQLEDLRNEIEGFNKAKKAWLQEKADAEVDMETKKKDLMKTQTEVELLKLDVEQQRNQLFRKLEALKEKGIILAPNMAVLKSDGSAAPGPQGGATPPAPPPPDVLFYHHHPELQGSDSPSEGNKLRQQPHAVSTKRSSSMNRMDQQLAPANSVATGGSLKKDSFAAFGAISNPHQFSHVNEAKMAAAAADTTGGAKVEPVKQVIPKNLSVHSKTSTHHKLSVSTRGGSTSTSALLMPDSSGPKKKSVMSASASVSQLPSSSQQLLPFKLSESGQQQQQLSPGASGRPAAGSKLSSSSFGSSTADPRLATYQAHSQYDSLHQRTGSSPHLLVGQQQQQQGLTQYHQQQQMQQQQGGKMNTLPKKERSPHPQQQVPSDDDKQQPIIYF